MDGESVKELITGKAMRLHYYVAALEEVFGETKYAEAFKTLNRYP